MASVSIRHRLLAFAGNLRYGESRQRARDFAQAILLLTLAMLAALFSSSSARDGRVAATLAGALTALAIAVWVGLRLVPRLAAGVEWRWLPLLTRYRLTWEGSVYLASTAVVILAAVNTSNNLLYMILSALLAVIVLSGFLSGLNFRMIDLAVRLPDHCFATEPFQMEIAVRNQKQVFPSFSLQVQPTDGSVFLFPSFYLPLVRVRQRDTRMVPATLPQRGRYSVEALHVQSRYPFGFFMKAIRYSVQAECVAFPEILPRQQLASSTGDILGSSARFERGHGIDLYGIRDYQLSDNARLLDWKASAKTSALKTREFAAEESHHVRIGFDRYGVPGQEAQFEHLVSQAASLALYLIRDGTEVSLVSDDWQSMRGRSENSLLSILRYLALVEMRPAALQATVDDREPMIRFSLRSPSLRQPVT